MLPLTILIVPLELIALFSELIVEFLIIKLESSVPSTKLYESKSTFSISSVPSFINNVVFKLLDILLGLVITSDDFLVIILKLFNILNTVKF